MSDKCRNVYLDPSLLPMSKMRVFDGGWYGSDSALAPWAYMFNRHIEKL